jgi:hypothetical protein
MERTGELMAGMVAEVPEGGKPKPRGVAGC